MKEILLTRGKITLVDDADYEALATRHWCFATNGYVVSRIGGGMIYLHRFLLNASPEHEVDHIDGNKLNNQRSNLRLVTRQQNARNVASHGGSSSLFKGVAWCKQTQRWRAHITVNGMFKHLGRFDTEHEAAHVYDTAARQYFGEFARTNFPQEEQS